MAQMLAVPGHVRHGFSINCSFNYDFGRITGIAASTNGNILVCDYDKKNLILFNPVGNYFKKLNLDSEPYDVAITHQNIGYVTQPNIRSALKIDPERMVVLLKATCNDLNTSPLCVSAFPNTNVIYTCNLSLHINGVTTMHGIYDNSLNCILLIKKRLSSYAKGFDVVKIHATDDCLYSCIAGQNNILVDTSFEETCSIGTIDTPTDICSDDYGHIYVSGQGSNNIYRLQKKFGVLPTVLDIPLHSQHGIKQPVAICFIKVHTKLYIVNEWGKSVLVFDVC
ncbi:TRIM2_3 [Mytilus coruscus]|uniref:TRIM2_3 n=1 Tax=Mytilus coruscus TaxID=42192 RepID=A0A6J8B8P2_MYTCO|nr:TRIM2_3 [Mytilus coruscus]